MTTESMMADLKLAPMGLDPRMSGYKQAKPGLTGQHSQKRSLPSDFAVIICFKAVMLPPVPYAD
jgi:hypothetical protein